MMAWQYAVVKALTTSIYKINNNVINRTVLPRKAMLAGFLIAISAGAVGQELFEVRNQKNQKWPEAEAKRIYLLASEAVEREFRLNRPMRPKFTLVLGAETDLVDGNSGELRLKTWNRRLSVDGVILFSIDQMVTPEVRTRLQQRTLLAADAVVSVENTKPKPEAIHEPVHEAASRP